MKKNQTNDEILIEFVNKIIKTIEIRSIILFGSRARGDYTKKSDFDLIIVDSFKEDFIQRPLSLLKLNQTKYNFELFCYTVDEFDRMFKKGNVMILDALYEGIPVFGKEFFNLYKKEFNMMIKNGLRRSRCTWVLP